MYLASFVAANDVGSDSILLSSSSGAVPLQGRQSMPDGRQILSVVQALPLTLARAFPSHINMHMITFITPKLCHLIVSTVSAADLDT